MPHTAMTSPYSCPLPAGRPRSSAFPACLALLALALAGASTAAHATGGISCASQDGHTRVELTASLSDTGPHAGIVSLALTRFGSRTDWAIASARFVPP